jgi:hypothetical protein
MENNHSVHVEKIIAVLDHPENNGYHVTALVKLVENFSRMYPKSEHIEEFHRRLRKYTVL